MNNIDTNNCKFKDKFYGTCEATRDKDGECELACFDCKDCYYRQLQQLKYDVECAELRNKYDKEQFDNELQRLKAELQAYKDKVRPVNFVDSDEYLKIVVENKQLKAENEGLQSLNDFNVQKIETLEAENEELRKSNTSNAKAFLKENKEKHKLLDCIDEIEEIVTYCRNTNNCYECNHFDECDVTEEDGIPSRDVCKVIIQKIKQAKEGN